MGGQPRNSGRRTVVGIFGGNNVSEVVLAMARSLAGALAARGFVTLTGAVKPNDDEVKGVVLKAVEKRVPWIGVHNCRECAQAGTLPRGPGLEVHPMMKERRNLLEAILCDAAIVLPGGSGTVSEVVCMLCLDKPVLLVGSEAQWQKQGYRSVHGLFSSRRIGLAAAEALVKATLEKLGSSTAGPLQDRIGRELSPERLLTLPNRCEAISAVDGFGDVITSWLDGIRLGYPSIPGHEKVGDSYEDWLSAAGAEQADAATQR